MCSRTDDPSQNDRPKREHSNHPGEYRPFGYDTVWCPVCDKPNNREKVGAEGRCPEHGP